MTTPSRSLRVAMFASVLLLGVTGCGGTIAQEQQQEVDVSPAPTLESYEFRQKLFGDHEVDCAMDLSGDRQAASNYRLSCDWEHYIPAGSETAPAPTPPAGMPKTIIFRQNMPDGPEVICVQVSGPNSESYNRLSCDWDNHVPAAEPAPTP